MTRPAATRTAATRTAATRTAATRTAATPTAANGGDAGQVSPLVLGYLVLVVTAALVLHAAARVHLARHRLTTMADAAARAGAAALDPAAYYRAGLGRATVGPGRATAGPGRATTRDGRARVPLSGAEVRRRVADHVADETRPPGPGRGLSGVRAGPRTGCPDGVTAVVELQAEVSLELPGGFGPRVRVPLTVTAAARSDTLP